MAIFSSKKETDTKQKSIRPTVIRTENVAKELLHTASSNHVNVSTLDFNILEMETSVRDKTSKDTAFKEISEKDLRELKNSSSLLDPNFEIKQSYEIEIFTKKPRPAYDKFLFSIGVNATMCKVYLTIKEGSFVAYNENFENDFLELINKKKIRANILVGVFDDMVTEVITKLNATLRVNETKTFEKAESILVAESVEPVPTIDDKVILHFREKNKKDETDDKIDYSKRSFILSVVKDELLMEYIKPKKGIPGRNCRGEFIDVKEPSTENIPTFKISEKISVVETENATEYRAKNNGYIVFENDTYDIKEELDINEISFKTTGSIETQLDADVSLKVKETDAMKDAVGTGMEVEVSELDVDGNIGPKARITAKRVKVDGQTHKTSFIRADDLTINVHKGTAEGDVINITRLEQGIVIGNTVDIKQAIGGNIRARNVVIDLIGSNATVTASKSIEINNMQGSENRFIIDPLAVDVLDVDISGKEVELDELDVKMRSFKKEIEKYSSLVQKNEKTFIEIKKKLMHYKKNDIKMPEAFIKQYKQFQRLQTHLDELKSSYEESKTKRDRLNVSINSVQENILNARIINKDKWVGYNEIRFKLIDPPVDVVYSPPEGTLDKIFALFKTDNDEYIIKAIKE